MTDAQILEVVQFLDHFQPVAMWLLVVWLMIRVERLEHRR